MLQHSHAHPAHAAPAEARSVLPVEAAARPAEAPGPVAADPKLSEMAAQMADWILAAGDNRGLPFVIVDKRAASAFAFDPAGHLQGGAPVLVGLARGDVDVQGIGARAIGGIHPSERITPAGRFAAHVGKDLNETVIWVDYSHGIALHPVVTTRPQEHRLERIRSRDPADHRISFGCINVPAPFFWRLVREDFVGGRGVVYVLPDTRQLTDVFPSFGTLSGGDKTADQAALVDPDDKLR